MAASLGATGDFNGDGKTDLVAANHGTSGNDFSDGSISALLGNGDGTFQTASNFALGMSVESLAVGDLSGDGIPDVVVFDDLSNKISVLPVNYSAGGDPYPTLVGDLNMDGKPDIVVANDGGDLSLLFNTCPAAGMDFAIAHSTNKVTISWSLPSARFVLQTTSSLSAPDWQTVTDTAETNNGRVELSVEADQAQRYFGLSTAVAGSP